MSENLSKKLATEKEEGIDWKGVFKTIAISAAQGFFVGFVSAAGSRAFTLMTRPKLTDGNVVSLDTRKAV